MSIKQSLFSLLSFFIISHVLPVQTSKPATDFLHVAGPVMFNNKAYNLSWTNHPNPTFYKQEYLVKGDDANKY